MSERGKFLPRVSVVGVGAVTPLGRELEVIAQRLGEVAPDVEACLRVGDELLADAAISKRMRRADRFTRMATIAAMDAWNMAKPACAEVLLERVGLIVVSGFGPHCRGFGFLDGILECGDAEALPTDFSHSVHCAAAAYITELLGLRGPSLTTTAFENGFEQAIVLAQCWLEQKVCDRVIVGAAEEVGEVLIHCALRMVGEDRRIVAGEGAVFFTLARGDVAGIAQLEVASEPWDCDLMMLDVPVIPFAEDRKISCHARAMATFSPYFGQMPCSSAFQLLGGLLSLRAGRALGRMIEPVVEVRGSSLAVDNAATYKPSFDPHATSLVLTRCEPAK